MRIIFCCLIVVAFLSANGYCEEDDYARVNGLIYIEAKLGNANEVIRYIADPRLQTDPNFANNKFDNNTALHVAAENGHEDCVAALLVNGWNASALNDYDKTPLHISAEKGYYNISELLVKSRSDINAISYKAYTPLGIAAEKGHKKIVEMLLDYGARLYHVDIVGSSNITAEMLDMIEKERINVTNFVRESEEDPRSLSPIVIGDKEKVHQYITKAVQEGRDQKYLNWLIREFNGEIITYRNEYGNTLLHVAVANGYLGIVKALIYNGADINAVNIKKVTPLHYAAQKGYDKIMELLLRRGANIEAKTEPEHLGNDALHYAAYNGNWACAYLLLLRGADANSQNSKGFTPLHLAISYIHKLGYEKDPSYQNYVRTIEVLLQSNSDRHIKSDEGISPIDYARHDGIIEMFRQVRSPAQTECIKNSRRAYTNSRKRRTANGVPASFDEYPWMAAVGGRFVGTDLPIFYCGGTIISEKFVMTAAHCIEATVPMLVRVGTENIREEATKGQDYDVEEYMRNNYRLTIKEHAFVSNANDIALLRLKTPINFSYLVSPACLYLGRREECGKKNLIVTGWGATEETTRSDQLLKTNFLTMPRLSCSKYYENREITDSQYCAYDPSLKSDACAGDTGGPLQYFPTGSHLAYVLGVVSYGADTCPSKTPRIYTKVGYYLDWIQSHVWPNQTAIKYFEDQNVNQIDSGNYDEITTTEKGKLHIPYTRPTYNSYF